MDKSQAGFGLILARIGAVVLALGALTYFVVNAQQNAQSSEPSGATEGAPADGELDDKYFPSSKGMIAPTDGGFDSRGAAEEKPKDRYLPSSKSLPFTKEKILPAERDEQAKAEAEKKAKEAAKKKAGYWHSSKSLRLPKESMVPPAEKKKKSKQAQSDD